jgi:hypothetical protein
MRLCTRIEQQRALFAALTLFVLLVWPARPSLALSLVDPRAGQHSDLLYIVSFSSAQQPYGPLVVYRAFGADLRESLPVVVVPRGPLTLTPVLFPSPDGRRLAILNPLSTGYDSNLNGASLSMLPTDGSSIAALTLARHVALSDPVIWSADGSALYYLTGADLQETEEIHRVDLRGHDVTLFHQPAGQGSLRLVGLDRSGALILTLARAGSPVTILRLNVDGGHHGRVTPTVMMTLPRDILPGNVLGVASSGASGLSTLTRSADGAMLVTSQVLSVRGDLAAQGIPNVPAQERLVLIDARTGARQALQLPPGGQVLQAFWAARADPSRAQGALRRALVALLPGRQRVSNGPEGNAVVYQQDEWMLEGHANRLFDGPALPLMCYGLCTALNGAPHVSAAILHGVAYTESDWHQFNTPGFQVNGEAVGSPLESFDGGWGEYQQTWGMPPQCKTSNNCRADAFRIEHDQSYNIGVGIQSLIHAWNSTAGVASSSDPNDPYKANDWFFAVWAYNGAYGNNPNDVPSSQYGHWYPGAPFNSIYEERVWYFAAHPQYASTGWTDNFVPGLGPSLLPPQSDFTATTDSFVYCVTCTIPDWTAGSYDREWVGYGAPGSQAASSFTAAFTQLGGENALGLPRDNGGGAAVHRWGGGLAQDFAGGSEQPGALLLADGAAAPYWVSGSIWTQYLVADHGAPGCHGYPTSNLNPFVDPGLGSDTYLRQTFQQGYMIWDATISVVVADACA